VLTDKVDIAHARLEFARRRRRQRYCQPRSTNAFAKCAFSNSRNISLDYARRDALRVRVDRPGPEPQFGFEKLESPAVEPLRAELEAFLDSIRTRKQPKTNGESARPPWSLPSRNDKHPGASERVQLTDSRRAPRPAASFQKEDK